MPVAYVESKADVGSMETAKDDWAASTSPTSIDHVEALKLGRNRVVQVITYTA